MSAEVSRITLLWHFEFASPVALHGGGSDLNTSSLRSGDKERAQPGCCQKPQKKGSKNFTFNTAVYMLGGVCSLDGGICVCVSGGLWAYMATKVHLGVYTFACNVCLPKGRASCPLIIHQQRPYMSIPETLSPIDPDTLLRGCSWRKPERKLDTPTSWAAPLTNSSSIISILAANHVCPLMQCTSRCLKMSIKISINKNLRMKICCYKSFFKTRTFWLQMDGKKV